MKLLKRKKKVKYKIVNRCNVVECKYKKDAAVFKVPKKNPELKEKWFKFLTRKDLPQENYLFKCEHHFEEKYLKKENDHRTRLRAWRLNYWRRPNAASVALRGDLRLLRLAEFVRHNRTAIGGPLKSQ